MNKFQKMVIFSCLALLLLAACGKRTMVVLLPDPNGKVGQVEVTNPQGNQALSEAYQSTVVARPGTPPQDPVVMPKAAVEKEFERAFKIMPPIPIIYTIFFDAGAVTVKDYSQALLPDIVKAIENRQSTDISVVGHTDKAGADEADRTLAFARARKVADLLIAMGVDALIVEVGYHGAGNPLVLAPGGIHETKNRRVDVTIR